jgi:hypothetical protein
MKKIIVIIFPFVILLTLVACTSRVDKKNSENPNGANFNIPGGMLHTAGNKILNEKDEEVRLVGVNICSLEWNSRGDNVLASTREVFTNWNCNLVRLPLSQDRWFGKVSDWSTPNPPDGGAQYRKIADDVIKFALSSGKYIVLDLHWSNAGEWGKNIGQHYMPDVNSLEFWIDAAGKYSNNSAVLFGLYNEPHDITWEVWRNGGTVNETENKGKPDEKKLTYNTPGHQKIVNEIRALGANNIIVAGGLDWAYDLRGIASYYALTDTPEGNGIVYDSHIYPWKEWDGKNHDAKVLCIAGDYPVLIGEIGIDPEGQWGAASHPSWLIDMLDWMDLNKLNWAGWCFHTAATPNMISDWRYTPTKHHGAVIKQRLLSYPNS